VDENKNSDQTERCEAHNLAVTLLAVSMFVMLLVMRPLIPPCLKRSLLRLLPSKAGELLANVVHEGSQPNVLILIHLIAIDKGSRDLLEIVFGVAR